MRNQIAMAKIDLAYLANLTLISNHINTCLMSRPLGLLSNKGDNIIMDKIRHNIDKAFVQYLIEYCNDKKAFELLNEVEDEDEVNVLPLNGDIGGSHPLPIVADFAFANGNGGDL